MADLSYAFFAAFPAFVILDWYSSALSIISAVSDFILFVKAVAFALRPSATLPSPFAAFLIASRFPPKALTAALRTPLFAILPATLETLSINPAAAFNAVANADLTLLIATITAFIVVIVLLPAFVTPPIKFWTFVCISPAVAPVLYTVWFNKSIALYACPVEVSITGPISAADAFSLSIWAAVGVTAPDRISIFSVIKSSIFAAFSAFVDKASYVPWRLSSSPWRPSVASPAFVIACAIPSKLDGSSDTLPRVANLSLALLTASSTDSSRLLKSISDKSISVLARASLKL